MQVKEIDFSIEKPAQWVVIFVMLPSSDITDLKLERESSKQKLKVLGQCRTLVIFHYIY